MTPASGDRKRTVAFGYCRVSTEEQAATGNGLDAQERAIRAECERRGWRLADVVRDEGASGKSLDRPGLRDVLERLAQREAGILVVSRLDRLSRSVIDYARVLEFCDRAGVAMVALDLAIDTGTPGGRLVANVFASVAEWERETIAQRTRDGLASVRAKGQPISRPAVVDDPILAGRIESMRDAGLSLRAIARQFNAEGIPTPRGGREWRLSSVQSAAGYRRPKPARPEIDLPQVARR